MRVSSTLATALCMVPECLLPACRYTPDAFDEYDGGWFWYREDYEEPKRVDPLMAEIRKRLDEVLILGRNVQRPTHDPNDDCA